jgi:uncharacterized protein YecE (DUF72 family)
MLSCVEAVDAERRGLAFPRGAWERGWRAWERGCVALNPWSLLPIPFPLCSYLFALTSLLLPLSSYLSAPPAPPALGLRLVGFMAGSIRIGTSGWNYKHWRERFYPRELPVKRWFEFYARHFDTVEINNTFYRWPKPEVFEAWREQAPAEFLYAVKANRLITHMKKLTAPEEPLERLYSRALLLEKHLGPVLFQLPPKWQCNAPRLGEFCGHLRKRVAHVFEFRVAGWLCDEVLEVLRRRRMSLCVHDLLPDHPRLVTAKTVYLRFHGATGKYHGSYSAAQLRPWARWIREQAAVGRDVFVYFNNDIEGHAVVDAARLRELVG